MNPMQINGLGGFRGARGEGIAGGRDAHSEQEGFSLTQDEVEETLPGDPTPEPLSQFVRMAEPELSFIEPLPQFVRMAQEEGRPLAEAPVLQLPGDAPTAQPQGEPAAPAVDEAANTPEPGYVAAPLAFRGMMPVRLPPLSTPETKAAPAAPSSALPQEQAAPAQGEAPARLTQQAITQRELMPLLRLAAHSAAEPAKEGGAEVPPEIPSLKGGPVPVALQRPSELQWAPLRLADPQVQWGQQLVAALKDKVELQVGQQIKQAHIRLDPPELGRLELHVRMDGDRVTVQLNAANPAVRDALIQSMERLRSALMPHHAGGVEVNVGQGGAGQQEQAPRDQVLAGRRALMEEEVVTTDAVGWLDTLV
ncbi:flagellar hook-length control protein FliK [Aeromonas diversa]|uniref:LafE n=1 Tax=Aeromonas diversa CDC 2478-85 TaxID=1268237 RepID=N9TZ47_9GAMM|nr:flagellar hook-length control protein FliK [Aeromonas diversa]ENY71394.1 LafE [Aeromonas diversa CDC 2478-85]